MNIVLGVKIEEALKDVKTAKELAKVLEELGIETTYLSLKGKEDEYLKLFKKRQQEIENIQKGYPAEREYSIEDIYMVRATDLFSINNLFTIPKDGQVTSRSEIGNHPALFKRVCDKKGINIENLSPSERENIYEESDKYFPLLRQYRATKHFTLNTLVTANNGGDWSDMPYVYFEPLKNHINDESLKRLSPHDTFFRGDVQLESPTLMLTEGKLRELLETKNPDILETLTHTKLILLDDNYKETASKHEYARYVLEKIIGVPFYKCFDHGVEIDGSQGVYSAMVPYASERGIRIGGDHWRSKEKHQDTIHFTRNIAEDRYRYMVFVRNNPKFNLSKKQIEVFDKYIEEFHGLCEECAEHDVAIDFNEGQTPELLEGMDDPKYIMLTGIFEDLCKMVEEAFDESGFYETVDLDVLEEETKKYNDEYEKALKDGAEYNRGSVFRAEKEAKD